MPIYEKYFLIFSFFFYKEAVIISDEKWLILSIILMIFFSYFFSSSINILTILNDKMILDCLCLFSRLSLAVDLV